MGSRMIFDVTLRIVLILLLIEYSSAIQRQWSQLADYIIYNYDLWGHGICIFPNYGS